MTKDTKTEKTTDDKDATGKVLNGVVVSDKMQDTLVVAVTRFVKHPKYRKFIKRIKKYHVHSPNTQKEIGDKVSIKECKPISKTKRFIIVESD